MTKNRSFFTRIFFLLASVLASTYYAQPLHAMMGVMGRAPAPARDGDGALAAVGNVANWFWDRGKDIANSPAVRSAGNTLLESGKAVAEGAGKGAAAVGRGIGRGFDAAGKAVANHMNEPQFDTVANCIQARDDLIPKKIGKLTAEVTKYDETIRECQQISNDYHAFPSVFTVTREQYWDADNKKRSAQAQKTNLENQIETLQNYFKPVDPTNPNSLPLINDMIEKLRISEAEKEKSQQKLKEEEAQSNMRVKEKLAGVTATAHAMVKNAPLIIGSLSFLIVLNYVVKETASYVKEKIQEPVIEQERSLTPIEKFVNLVLDRKVEKSKNLHDVILAPDLQEELDIMAVGVQNCINNGANLPHILFCGPPGTGKTAFAKRFARRMKFKYKTFSPADLEQADEEKALRAFKEMLTQISEPTLILIDECEVLFKSRTLQTSEKTHKLLNLFLSITSETDNKNYMIIGITNLIEHIDSAVISRFNKTITIPLPAYDERFRIFKKYIDTILRSRKKSRQHISFFDYVRGKRPISEKPLNLPDGAFDDDVVAKMTAALEGLSGRDIEKLIDNMKIHALGKKDRSLSLEEIEKFIMDQARKARVALPDNFTIYPRTTEEDAPLVLPMEEAAAAA